MGALAGLVGFLSESESSCVCQGQGSRSRFKVKVQGIKSVWLCLVEVSD